MKLYELYISFKRFPGTKGYNYVVARTKKEAFEILCLVYGYPYHSKLRRITTTTIERISSVNPAEGGYIKCRELTKDWNTGYFDVSQGMSFEHRKNKHWYPFVEFTVRGHYIDAVLEDLNMSE